MKINNKKTYGMKLKNQKKTGHTFTFSRIERKEWRKKRNDRQRQTTHHPPQHTEPVGRGHGDTSKDTIKG